MSNINLYNYVDSIKDFPKKGILFRDISPLLQDYNAFSELRALFYNESVKHKIDYVAGLDARGFLFSSLLSQDLKVGSIMIRKSNKLPGDLHTLDYDLEYGKSSLSIQKSRDIKGKKIILIDDLLATGGTLKCAENLIHDNGGQVVLSMVAIELLSLKGRENLSSNLFSILQYD
tara:strand:+ start:1722 stop:2243 length:522 start_codon:yes stop_codon:yes gene_type:complete